MGELPQEVSALVLGLPLPALKELSEALLDFTSLADLQAWLTQQANGMTTEVIAGVGKNPPLSA